MNAISNYVINTVIQIIKDCEYAKEHEISDRYGKEQAEISAYREIKEFLDI